MAGYCMKCRGKRELKDAQPVTLKNGRAATRGTCAVCGTTITAMGGAKGARQEGYRSPLRRRGWPGR